MKLTDAQRRILQRMMEMARISFGSTKDQETACELDAMGLSVVHTDSGNSLGVVVGSITEAGRAALNQPGTHTQPQPDSPLPCSHSRETST